MSYASVTAQNLPPEHEQVKPSQSLLDPKDVDSKVGQLKDESAEELEKEKREAEKLKKEGEKKASQWWGKAQAEGEHLEKEAKEGWSKGKKKAGEYETKGRKEFEKHPEVYTSIISAVNLAILGGVALAAYKNWDKPWDRRVVGATTAGLLCVFGIQGYVGTVEYQKSKDD